MRTMRWWWLIPAGVLGCGSPGGTHDSGAMDSGFVDTGVHDVGSTGDVGALPDMGVAVDSGGTPGDRDGDGVATAMDCDDLNPYFSATGSRPCTSTCGTTGAERCADGVWFACDAPVCTCETPGATRTAACGMCGRQQQRCGDAARWEATGPCVGEMGVCLPGQRETPSGPRCSIERRECTAMCQWRGGLPVVPPGECEAGVTVEDDLYCTHRMRDCNSDCTWGATRTSSTPGECPGAGISTCPNPDDGDGECTVDCMWVAGACPSRKG